MSSSFKQIGLLHDEKIKDGLYIQKYVIYIKNGGFAQCEDT